MYTLYQCQECKEQYVVSYGIICCPYCYSKEREDQGYFEIEDINNLLAERKELQEKIIQFTKKK